MPVTRVDLPPPPPFVQRVLDALRAAGGRAWLIGGTVRDLLLGLAPSDFDVATDLRAERVATLLPHAPLREAWLGVCRVLVDGHEVGVTTLRHEADYTDHRHPSRVEFVTDVGIDARRRDFTVNALYLDPDSGELTDPTGGVEDLAARRLRAVGDAERRFVDDPLRLLRLLRFAARCGLTVEPETAAAARRTAAGLSGLSAQRCFDELTRTFTGPGRDSALRLLVDLGVAQVLLPEVAAMDGVPQPPEFHPEGCVLTHVGLVLGHVAEDDPVLAWSAVLHDVGKPPTFRRGPDRIRFDGHDVLSEQLADAVLRRLEAPRLLRERVMDVCRQHIRFAALPSMRPLRAERWLREPHFADHLAFHRADCLGSHGDLSIHDWAQARLDALPPLREPLLHGRDVLALGVPAGPAVGELLRAAEARLEESPTPPDRAAALVLLRDVVDRFRQAGD
ncbi:MAG: CCA tRNA nucleotidyltransferase [Planctomycetes bacterium]|nr:CCA tRNA nucleotidyltransferase [Planctomycetota bacterium]